MPPEPTKQRVPIRELVRYYLRLGLLGFGGPVALVGQMEREMVGEKKWLTKEEMREGIAVCQSLPGPLAIRAEVAWIFLAAGAVGILYYGSLFRTRSPASTTSSLLLGVPLVAGVGGEVALGTMLGKLFTFFLKAGSLTFGSGLVIVPFLEKGLVQQTGWLNEREFLVAVAMGMMSPGPVVITATFVGYLVAGFLG